MIHGVLFDLDNTLLDFMSMKRAAIEAAVWAMIDSGMPMSHSDATAAIYRHYDKMGIEYQEIFDLFLKDQFKTIDHKWLASGIVAYRRARNANLTLYPHTRETLTELLKRGLKLAVISDAPRLGAWLRLCQVELHHTFDPVITFEDSGHRKPSRVPFELALEKMNLRPHEVIMIGDWPDRDMVGAKAMGIQTVFARYGDTKNTVESGADFEIDDISQLINVLDKIEVDADQTTLFE